MLLLALCFVPLLTVTVASVGGAQWLLWRSVSVPGLTALPDLWTLNSSELYEATFESLQWLSPTDLRRFDFLSPSSTYQINRRYRSGASVKRYYGHQLWKLHETRLRQPKLRTFLRHFGSHGQQKHLLIPSIVMLIDLLICVFRRQRGVERESRWHRRDHRA